VKPTWATSGGAVQTLRIYALIDPRDGRVRYVGCTSKEIKRRVIEHMNAANTGNRTAAKTWLSELRGLGLKPIGFLLEFTDAAQWESCESAWIARFRGKGCDLCNTTSGGMGMQGHKFTDDHRNKIATGLKTGSVCACQVCGKTFYRKRNQVLAGNCRFCSRQCNGKWQAMEASRAKA
jgi:hypothetical protein